MRIPKHVNTTFPHYTYVRSNNSTRARLGWIFSYICCIFAHFYLDSVPLFAGMKIRSIDATPIFQVKISGVHSITTFSCASVATFKQSLKTFLFKLAYRL